MPVIEARLRALQSFYAPLGDVQAQIRQWPSAGLIVGRLAVGHRPDPLESVESWGEQVNARWSDPEALLGATNEELREDPGMFMVCGVTRSRARIVTSAAGPAPAYVASSEQLRVWSTHAVACGWLARGSVQLDSDALPEHVAFDFVGGRRTLLSGVSTVPPGSVVDLVEGAGSTSTYWSDVDRWEPVPEEEAYCAAETGLLRTLERRVGRSAAMLGLTAGKDSRVLAAALKNLDIPFSSFTWGEPGWPDVVGATALAAALGVPHRTESSLFLNGDEALSELDRLSRWCDGVTSLALAQRTWPGETDAWITGAGGETGRAYYWGRAYRESADPTDLLRVLRVERRLGPGANPSARELLSDRVAEWVMDAQATNASGWRTLDVLYAEQRVRRWGRSQIPPLPGAFVGGFTPVAVARPLSSLRIGDRLTDEFARQFVHRRAPALASASPAAGDRRSPFRLLAHRVRSRVSRRTQDGGDPVLRALLADRPQVVDYVAGVLESEWAVDRLGSEWSHTTMRGVMAAQRRPTERAFALCGPIALASAIAELNAAGDR
jgi:hypothetical protein